MKFKRIHPECWPPTNQETLSNVYKNKQFFVQEYHEPNGVIRLSICNVKRKGSRWVDGITWDELNEIKKGVGYGDYFAVECYPETKHIVDVANMRHLWIMPERLDFAWQRK